MKNSLATAVLHLWKLNFTKYLQNSFSRSCCLKDRYTGRNSARFDAITDARLGGALDGVGEWLILQYAFPLVGNDASEPPKS
jgi:hypothetical protein